MASHKCPTEKDHPELRMDEELAAHLALLKRESEAIAHRMRNVLAVVTPPLRPSTFDRAAPSYEALTWVSYVYRRAMALGKPPKQAVAVDLGVSPATAGRWIAAAREYGTLTDGELTPRGRYGARN